jgi:hypothetical protein
VLINAGNQGNLGLEILFHEGSHTVFSKIFQAVIEQAGAQNRLYLLPRPVVRGTLLYGG